MPAPMKNDFTSLSEYTLLGRSGLRVSPLCLGAMTFGNATGWGTEEKVASEIFDRYLEAGGNFVDTADGYQAGESEKMLGRFIRETKSRDRVVLATKFTFNGEPGNPNAGGNGRKNVYRALETSLRRLETDYVDLYWLHAWDGLTPVEEVVETLDALVRAGKVRYIGLSDTPAWYLARAQTLAELRGYTRICALQLEYSLVERTIEREHVPAALELGMAVCPWSPLASGLLTGKYTRSDTKRAGDARLATDAAAAHPLFSKLFTDRNWSIVEVLADVAREIGRSPAAVALNWITRRPGVATTIIGATRVAQLDDNLSALSFEIPTELSAKLEEASRPPLSFPYTFYTPEMRSMLNRGAVIRREPGWFRPAS